MDTTTTPTPARTYAGYQYKCVTCEMEIEGKPEFHLGLAFCCAGCAVSGPCTCSYDDRPSPAVVKAAAELCDCHRVAEPVAEPVAKPVADQAANNDRHWLMEPVPTLTR